MHEQNSCIFFGWEECNKFVNYIHPSVIGHKCWNFIGSKGAISYLNCNPSAVNEKLESLGTMLTINFKMAAYSAMESFYFSSDLWYVQKTSRMKMFAVK